MYRVGKFCMYWIGFLFVILSIPGMALFVLGMSMVETATHDELAELSNRWFTLER